MFMTTKTHKRILSDALDNVLYTSKIEHAHYIKTVEAKQNIIDIQRHQIADMQHFYNKGRAVHAADVRYEAKKRAKKASNKRNLDLINEICNGKAL